MRHFGIGNVSHMQQKILQVCTSRARPEAITRKAVISFPYCPVRVKLYISLYHIRTIIQVSPNLFDTVHHMSDDVERAPVVTGAEGKHHEGDEELDVAVNHDYFGNENANLW